MKRKELLLLAIFLTQTTHVLAMDERAYENCPGIPSKSQSALSNVQQPTNIETSLSLEVCPGHSIKQMGKKIAAEGRQKSLEEVLTPQVLRKYKEKGFAKIGKIMDEKEIIVLGNRLNQIMLGEVETPYEDMMMQLDSPTGLYEDAGIQTLGWKGPTLEYRKILYIEKDKIFGEFIFQKLFADICQTFHPEEKPFTYYRTMVMNKPANGGTDLPWHQDKWNIDEREPLFYNIYNVRYCY